MIPNYKGAALRRFSARESLSRKLPLLISALLVTAILLLSAIAYRQLTRALVTAGGVRMVSAAKLLGSLFEDSGKHLRTEVEQIAADSTLRKFAATRDARSRAVAESALARIAKAPQQQTLGIEVSDRQGRQILWVDGEKAKASAPFKDHPAVTPPTKTAIEGFAFDHGVLHYETVAPVVMPRGDTIGSVTIYKQIAQGQSAQIISGLIGPDVSFLLTSDGGKTWTDLAGVVPGPAHLGKPGVPEEFTGGKGVRRVGVVVPIRSMGWTLLVDVPVSTVLAPANRFLRDMGIAAIVLVLIGGIAAFFISRQITGPLADITEAAEGISAGDYSLRVNYARRDELGLLARSFNSMAEQVDEAHHVLEVRVQERTRALESALNELSEAQESLVRREKLAMLGQLAGGVGHELRNPLGVMTNAIYYLLMVLKDAPDNVKEYLGILKTQIALSEKIIGDLLDFARVKTPQFDNVPVEKIVRDQLERVGNLNGVKLVEKIAPNLPALRVDPVQIGQVVLNLFTNALQAMDGKSGTLEIRAARGSNGFVRLEVIDTGVGMTREQLDKVFEPLFTTKARGIGLGLAVSRSLVLANGGEISVSSESGKGSTLSVDLPIVKEAA
ncbi:MAG: sensor histidine kinase [Gemmatimonadaceae bacterium]